MAMAKRLQRAVREHATQDVVAEKSGVPKPTLQRILAGKSDPGDRLAAIVAAVDTTEEAILLGEQAYADRIVEVPITEIEVSAGPGRFAPEQEGGERWPLPRDFVEQHFGEDAQLRVVTVRGDSQEPDLRDGDQVVVNLSATTLAEGLHVVRLDEALMLKRVQVEGARVRLLSRNPAYEDIMVDLNADQHRFAIVAKAGWAVKRL